MKNFGTYKEAFLYRLEHNMESPVVEHAEAIQDVFCEWLEEADSEIIELKKEISKLKGEK